MRVIRYQKNPTINWDHALRHVPNVQYIDGSDQKLMNYVVPERGSAGHTPCVLLPETEEDVGAIIEAANMNGFKVVISAGRTGLVEAQRPEGEAVLSLECLNRIVAVDTVNGTAEVQAGTTVDTLNRMLSPAGLTFPIEMASISAATIGACVANSSAGSSAVCYGTAAHLCAEASGWWGNAAPAKSHSVPSWQKPGIDQLAINSAHVRPEWGLIGSQGILGVITRLTVRLTALPKQREAALIPVMSMEEATDLFFTARATFGTDIEEFEFISESSMNLVRCSDRAELRLPFEKDPRTPHYLLMQIKSSQAPEVDDVPARLYAFLHQIRIPDSSIGYAPLKALKKIRHSLTELSNQRVRALRGGRLAFDTATPIIHFGKYLDTLHREIKSGFPGYELITFGHAGVGGAHLHVLGTENQPVEGRAAEMTRLVLDITQSHGGTFSAEHGIGSKWGVEFLQRTPRLELAALLAAKSLRDPQNVLNPRCFGLNQLIERDHRLS